MLYFFYLNYTTYIILSYFLLIPCHVYRILSYHVQPIHLCVYPWTTHPIVRMVELTYGDLGDGLWDVNTTEQRNKNFQKWPEEIQVLRKADWLTVDYLWR